MLSGRGRLAIAAIAVLLTFVGRPLRGDEPCGEEACFPERARALLDSGSPREAVTLLKKGRAALPDAPGIPLLLARAYLASGNEFWAIRTLTDRLAAVPGDCEARSHLALVYRSQAMLDEAVDLLARTECTSGGPASTRFLMVRSLVDHARGEGELAARNAELALDQDGVWAVDRYALAELHGIVSPLAIPDFGVRVETALGYTTNALTGSAVDVLDQSLPSPFFQVDGWFRLTHDFGVRVQPVLEGQVRSVRYFADDARELSYLSLSARIGLLAGGPKLPRFSVFYRPDYQLLDRGDRYGSGPVWFFGAHRGDVEVEIPHGLLAFAGAGYRWFREKARTRIEVDAGLGGSQRLAGWCSFLWGATGRVYRAKVNAYNAYGVTALARANFHLPLRFEIRAGGSLSADFYTESAGYFDSGSRRDLFGRVSASVWSPSSYGVRGGITYDFTDRVSSVSAYDYSDHRVMVRMSVTWSGDIFLPRRRTSSGMVEAPWGTVGGAGDIGDRIQDLLRQDEQVMRSSSCVQ